MNELLDKAAQICVTKHAGQTDKVGQPYFPHSMRVAMLCKTNAEKIVALLHDTIEDSRRRYMLLADMEEKIVALLHDTIEDTDVTPEYLLKEGFPQNLVDAILSVTKRAVNSFDTDFSPISN